MKFRNYINISVLLFSFLLFSNAIAKPTPNRSKPHSKFSWHNLYVGASAGYGSTDWSMLVCKGSGDDCSEGSAVTFAAPVRAKDNGLVWGFFIGYQIMSNFLVELSYHSYPDSYISFGPGSIYVDDMSTLLITSKTVAYSFVGKFLIPIWHSKNKFYADAGFSFIHRKDPLANITRLTPTFGVGMERDLTKQLMMELAFQYHVGYGEAVLKPAEAYVPFLYSITLNLGYRLAA